MDRSWVSAKNRFFSAFFLRLFTLLPFPECPCFPTPWILIRIASGCADCLELAARRKGPLSLSNPSDCGWRQTIRGLEEGAVTRRNRVRSWKLAQLITTPPSHTRLYRHTHRLYFPVLAWLRCASNIGFYCDVIQIAVLRGESCDAKRLKSLFGGDLIRFVILMTAHRDCWQGCTSTMSINTNTDRWHMMKVPAKSLVYPSNKNIFSLAPRGFTGPQMFHRHWSLISSYCNTRMNNPVKVSLKLFLKP